VTPNKIPLEDANMSEVMARITFRLAQITYNRAVRSGLVEFDYWSILARSLYPLDFALLKAFVAAAARAVCLDHISAMTWRDTVILRSRRNRNKSFRHDLYPSYKKRLPPC
jgi:hypothetical protein